MYLHNEFIINILNDIITQSCPRKSNSKQIELTVHTSCYWGLRLTLRYNLWLLSFSGELVFCLYFLNFFESLLSIKNYRLEVETNSVKKRVGVYVMNGIEAIMRNDLEGVDSNLLILDIRGEQNFRLINVFRCFNPTKAFFTYQLGLIKAAFVKDMSLFVIVCFCSFSIPILFNY